MRFTDEQQKVIDAGEGGLLVAAAAGSGKTTVLVERVARLIAGGAMADEMLVVTFTRASAADLRLKLARRLSMGDMPPGQLVRLERATITTIHGFCSEVIKSHFEHAGAAPMFRVADEMTAGQLLDEALLEAADEAYERPSPELLALDYSRGPKGVMELARELMGILESRPEPGEWLDSALAPDAGGMIEVIRCEWLRRVREAIALSREALRLAGMEGGLSSYVSPLREDIAALEKMRALDYESLRLALAGFKQVRPAPTRGEGDDELREAAKALRALAKTEVEKAAASAEISVSDGLADVEKNLAALSALRGLTLRARELFEEKKREAGLLTYSDLETRAYLALKNPNCRQAVRERYRYAFVDEFQDTSVMQSAILHLATDARRAFFVGDVKQSIYRFRLAEPGLFLEKAREYSAGRGGDLLYLTRNFRSSAAIVDFVNAVFERAMRGGDDEIEYDERERLVAAGGEAGAGVETHVFAADERDDEDEDEVWAYTAVENEAKFIASRIHALMEAEPETRYRDIAVITRVKRGVLSEMARVLADNGVPSYADESGGYIEAFEIRLMISLLKLIDDGWDDVSLLAVLRSPVVGLSSEELVLLRLAAGKRRIWEGVIESEDSRLIDFVARIEKWRGLASIMSLSRLIDALAVETGILNYALAMPGGAAREANICLLSAKARAFEENNASGLNGFLQKLEENDLRGSSEGAHALSENDDVVRLMSAHKSKGLEFPIVFAAQLGRNFRAPKRDGRLISDAELGLGLEYADSETMTRRDTIPRLAISIKLKTKDLAEEKRILYVTLTRAMKRLILVGTVKSGRAAQNRWLAREITPRSQLDIIAASGAEITWHSMSANAASGVESDYARPKKLLNELLAAEEGEVDQAALAKMSWQYPYANDIDAPLKLTVTGLVRELEGPGEARELARRPAFMEEAASDAASVGTQLHRLIQYADLASVRAGEYPENARAGDFFRSELGARLLASNRVEREWAFNLRLDSSDAREYAGVDSSSRLFVQGVIDACFIEDGSWVLIDYKTGADNETYHRQVRLYAHALTEITGISVSHAYICLLTARRAVEVELY